MSIYQIAMFIEDRRRKLTLLHTERDRIKLQLKVCPPEVLDTLGKKLAFVAKKIEFYEKKY